MKKLEFSGFPKFLKNDIFEKMVFFEFFKKWGVISKMGVFREGQNRGSKIGVF